ncbi:hypothetical protein JCM19239_5309 [Vibrio variabilis]|uniref:Uncharacterized protein n=1 Tax=Vibrio variabilis TaxID=990271 RepID=A0ABQ0JNQ2_9VIBR|nr:hypothetical protein JCM19239_5309 [Vibrio variabilis]
MPEVEAKPVEEMPADNDPAAQARYFERKAEEAAARAKGLGNAGETLRVDAVPMKPQTIIGSMSEGELGKVLQVVNTAADGSRAMIQITDRHELIDALSDHPSKDMPEAQMARLMSAIKGKMGKPSKYDDMDDNAIAAESLRRDGIRLIIKLSAKPKSHIIG